MAQIHQDECALSNFGFVKLSYNQTFVLKRANELQFFKHCIKAIVQHCASSDRSDGVHSYIDDICSTLR